MAERHESMVAPDEAERRRIQRSRNTVLGLVLAGFALLFFFITIAKMG